MSQHQFLKPPLLKKVSSLMHYLDQCNHHAESWTIEDLDTEQQQTLIEFLEHIRKRKLEEEEHPGPYDHDHISVEICHFWLREAVEYLITRGEIIRDMKTHRHNPRLSKSTRGQIQETSLVVRNGMLSTSINVDLKSSFVFFVSNGAMERVQALPDLARRILPCLPDSEMSWKEKQQFMTNCENFAQMPDMMTIQISALARKMT